MSEREKIVAWLRREAEHRWHMEELSDEVPVCPPWITLKDVADAIEAGLHLKRSEPTIPASEWIPKSNLTHG